jgi:hypothetical protein
LYNKKVEAKGTQLEEHVKNRQESLEDLVQILSSDTRRRREKKSREEKDKQPKSQSQKLKS